MLKRLTKKLLLRALLGLAGGTISSGLIGMVLSAPLLHAGTLYQEGVNAATLFDPAYLTDPMTWALGGAVVLVVLVLWLALGTRKHRAKKILGGEAKGVTAPWRTAASSPTRSGTSTSPALTLTTPPPAARTAPPSGRCWTRRDTSR